MKKLLAFIGVIIIGGLLIFASSFVPPYFNITTPSNVSTPSKASNGNVAVKLINDDLHIVKQVTARGGLDPNVLMYAINAYRWAVKHDDVTNTTVLTIVDFSKSPIFCMNPFPMEKRKMTMLK